MALRGVVVSVRCCVVLSGKSEGGAGGSEE